MSLENISSALFTAGSGGVAGFAIGFALKKVIKILAVIIGVFLGALMYLQSQQIIEINWQRFQSMSESNLLVISNAMSNTEQISANYHESRSTLNRRSVCRASAWLLKGLRNG